MKHRIPILLVCLCLLLSGCQKEGPSSSVPEEEPDQALTQQEDPSFSLAFTPVFDGAEEEGIWGVSLGNRCYFARYGGESGVTVEAVDMKTGKCTQRESFELDGPCRMRAGSGGVALWNENRILTLDPKLALTGEMDMPWCIDAPLGQTALSEDFSEVAYISGDGVYLTPSTGSAPTLILSQPFVTDPENDGVFTSVAFCDNGNKLRLTQESETVRNRVLLVDRLNNLGSGNTLKSLETYAWHSTHVSENSRYGIFWFLPEADGVTPTTAVWLMDYTIDAKKELDLDYLSENGGFDPLVGEFAMAYNDGDRLCRLDFSTLAVVPLLSGCGPDVRPLAVSDDGDVLYSLSGGGGAEYRVFPAKG
ncbi:MAG: hypothetical protein PHD67_01925 [Oscillospiraceae bacterium]|nr:hypothetical protein [Oscillospiraceae bacterium]